jgi:DNA-binding response OmpR family regulator
VKVLIVDDDRSFRRLAQLALEGAGMQVFEARTARAAHEVLRSEDGRGIDAMLLDVRMPGMDGKEFLRSLRDQGFNVPVLFTTVLDHVSDKVEGFELGADDWLVKPYPPEELIARVQAIVRRTHRQHALNVGEITLDPARREGRWAGTRVCLTETEFRVAWALAESAGQFVHREKLYRAAWGSPNHPGTNRLEVCISRLRKKLGRLNSVRIESVPAQGYRLKA